jgi:hypothetical protein
MPLSVGEKLGPCEILAPIGAGGMGEVYKARDTQLDRTVAVKVLPEYIAKREDLRARFEREARAVASLMAYASDQPGQNEILIESIPPGKGRWQISTEGGDWPVWRRDGKELFFRQGTKIMAAPIRLTKASVESGKPQALFEVPANTRFQVSRDGH